MKRLAVVLGVLVLLLSGCILYPGQKFNAVQTADTLGGARFSQEQAVQGFDTSSHTLSDEQVEEFRDLLKKHDIDPGDYRAPEETFCPGGITTRVQMWFRDNGDKEMRFGSCADAGSFEGDATGFFTAVRTPSDSPAASNALIDEVSFATEGVPTIPDGSYVQDDAEEIDRLVELLDADGENLAELSSYGVTIMAADPCETGGSIDITARYEDDSPESFVPILSCGLETGALADLFALFAEWAEAD